MRRATALILALGLTPGAALAASAPPGATACSGCHGREAPASVGPPIAGRAAADIASAMDAYRSGARAGTVMPRIAKGFTTDETEAIARWWSEQAGVKP
ncbi:c-type cytochrome [Alsobacter sp. R-9]